MADKRYTVRLEWCGYPERRWVARFMVEWIGQALSEDDAWAMASEHDMDRLSC